MLRGRPHLRTPDGWRQLDEGEVVAFPVGERGAHQLANRTRRAGAAPDGERDGRPRDRRLSRTPARSAPGSTRRAAGARASRQNFRSSDAGRLLGRRAAAGGPELSESAPLGVVGAGTMGAGHRPGGLRSAASRRYLHDPFPEALERGIARVRDGSCARAPSAGAGRPSDATAAEARLHPAPTLDDLAPCELVIEAAPEDLELKRELFAQLSEICAPDVVLATNTSSLPVTALATRRRATRERRRHALLQPGAADGAAGGGRRRGVLGGGARDRARGRRADGKARHRSPATAPASSPTAARARSGWRRSGC